MIQYRPACTLLNHLLVILRHMFQVYHRLYDVLNLTVISDKDTVGYYDMGSIVQVQDWQGDGMEAQGAAPPDGSSQFPAVRLPLPHHSKNPPPDNAFYQV